MSHDQTAHIRIEMTINGQTLSGTTDPSAADILADLNTLSDEAFCARYFRTLVGLMRGQARGLARQTSQTT